MTTPLFIFCIITYLWFGMCLSATFVDINEDYAILKRCIGVVIWLPLMVIFFIGAIFYSFFKQ